MKIVGVQARINENGRVVIPAVIRKGMGLKLGDSVFLSLEDGVLRIEPHRATDRTRVRRTLDESRKIAKPGMPASSHRAQEQSEESQSEKEEWLG